jgi:hypothetical protein
MAVFIGTRGFSIGSGGDFPVAAEVFMGSVGVLVGAVMVGDCLDYLLGASSHRHRQLQNPARSEKSGFSLEQCPQKSPDLCLASGSAVWGPSQSSSWTVWPQRSHGTPMVECVRGRVSGNCLRTTSKGKCASRTKRSQKSRGSQRRLASSGPIDSFSESWESVLELSESVSA